MERQGEPKTILLIHSQGKLGGAENSLLNLLRGLDTSRFRIVGACPANGRFPDELRQLGVTVVPFTFPGVKNLVKLLRNSLALARLARRENACLLHSNTPQSNVPCGFAGRLAGIPTLWHARNILEPNMIDLDRLLSGLATHVVCNSQAIRNRLDRKSVV